MKFSKYAILFLTAFLAIAALFAGNPGGAALVTFAGLAAHSSWTDYRPAVFSANVIADELKLTKVLEFALVGFKAALLPLKVFSMGVSKDAIGGAGNDANNTVTVPVYDYTTGDAQDRTAGEAYSAKVSATSTTARQILINKEKVVGLSFTNEESQNQVAFDPEMHGLIKGRDLANAVITDIASVLRYGRFNGDTLAPMASTSFDETDVADLAQKGMEANWPDLPQPGLVLNPAFHFALLKQGALIDASKAGNADALRQAKINEILGFQETGTNAVPLNNGTGQTFTVVAATDLCTAASHGYYTGEQVVVSSATTLPAGLAAATYYYVIKISDNTFKLATSLANALAGTAIDITDTGTGAHTITMKTNLVGFAGAPSAIITGFRPVIPTPGIRQKLINFDLVDDLETGLTIEYRHIADEDKGIEYQVISCHYGYEYGIAAAMKLISKLAA